MDRTRAGGMNSSVASMLFALPVKPSPLRKRSFDRNVLPAHRMAQPSNRSRARHEDGGIYALTVDQTVEVLVWLDRSLGWCCSGWPDVLDEWASIARRGIGWR
jgi:hypothetical protein